MTDPGSSTVCAVIVSHQPEPAVLLKLVENIAMQTGAVVVVDNASDDARQPALARLSATGHATVLAQLHNVGLAAAQNIGIDWARANGYLYVLLLDQDSEPGADMVPTLMAALRALSVLHRVAAVGPRFHDPREGRDAPFVRVGFPLNHKLRCAHFGQTVHCDFLISSGSLVPLDVLDAVGSMDAALFIDNIDLEWSFRARSLGYTLHGVCAAVMQHRLGDARRALPFGLGQVVVHGPSRLYYMMRNRVRLYRMPHTPRAWIAQDMPRGLVKLLLFGVLIGPRWRNLHFMMRGLRDGVMGRAGACPLMQDD